MRSIANPKELPCFQSSHPDNILNEGDVRGDIADTLNRLPRETTPQIEGRHEGKDYKMDNNSLSEFNGRRMISWLS